MTHAILQHSITVRCPRCGTLNIIPIDYSKYASHPQVVFCDEDMGGCGEMFAIQAEVHITHKVYALTEVAESTEQE